MVELDLPAQSQCDKEIHVCVRKNGTRAKSAAKVRAKSPRKQNQSPTRKPWIPAPGKTTLRDRKGDLKVESEGHLTEKVRNIRKGNFDSREELKKVIPVYESTIISLLEELSSLRSKLTISGEGEQCEEVKIIPAEVPKKTKHTVEKIDTEDDVYTEIESNSPTDIVRVVQSELPNEPIVSKIYSSNMDECGSTEEDRNRLQRLLVKAEMDLDTLDFSDKGAVNDFLTTSRSIRQQLASLKQSNFDVTRLEAQRDAVVDRLAKTDSECALIRRALVGRETDLRETQIDNEINQERIARLQTQLDNVDSVKSKIQRELFTREGELNRSQARERVAQKEISELKAELNFERTSRGKTKLDLEKQALKKACKHHKTKAENISIQLNDASIALKRTQCELDAWRERSRRNIDEVEGQVQALHESKIEQKYAEDKILAKGRELREKDILIEEQAAEIGKLRVILAETKAHFETIENNRQADLTNAREDALASLQTLRDLPEELQLAHKRLDEAIKEIRRLEEKNADLEVQIHRSNTHLNLSQSAGTELKIYSQKLNSAEIRLEEIQLSLNEANEENDQIRQEATNWRLRADERQHAIAALERQMEALTVEHRRSLESEYEKYNIKERSNNNRLSELELEMTRITGELSAVKRQKDDAERRHELQLSDLRDRLENSEATNRSMQSYVNFLKSSYQNTFGDDLTE